MGEGWISGGNHFLGTARFENRPYITFLIVLSCSTQKITYVILLIGNRPSQLMRELEPVKVWGLVVGVGLSHP